MKLLVRLKKINLFALSIFLIFNNAKASINLVKPDVKQESHGDYLSNITHIPDIKNLVSEYLPNEWVLYKTFDFENAELIPNDKFLLKEETGDSLLWRWKSRALLNIPNKISVNLPSQTEDLLSKCTFSKNFLVIQQLFGPIIFLSLKDLKVINFIQPSILDKLSYTLAWCDTCSPRDVESFDSIAISGDEKYMAIGNRTIQIFDINTKKLIYLFDIDELCSKFSDYEKLNYRLNGWYIIRNIAFSSNNNFLAFSALEQIIILDLKKVIDAYDESNKTQRFNSEQFVSSFGMMDCLRQKCIKISFIEAKRSFVHASDIIYLTTDNQLWHSCNDKICLLASNVLDFICKPNGDISIISKNDHGIFIGLLGQDNLRLPVNQFKLAPSMLYPKAYFSPDGQEFTIAGHTPYNENGFEGMRFIQQLWVNKGKYLTGYYQQTYELKRQAERDIRRQVF